MSSSFAASQLPGFRNGASASEGPERYIMLTVPLPHRSDTMEGGGSPSILRQVPGIRSMVEASLASVSVVAA